MTYTFLITGASSGFGAQIALAALKAGHGVLATARNVAKAKESYPDIERSGGQWLTLDVTDPQTQSIVEAAVLDHKVNVLVNNAGFALRGVLEDLEMPQIRHQMETNVFGTIASSKGAVSYFRQQRSGTIVNISSTSGISGNAGYSLYAASKFAIEGFSESLSAELAPFNVRVLLVEPGGLRTNFQAAVTKAQHGGGDGEHVSEPYRGTPADDVARKTSGGHGKQPGDPAKAAQAIVEVVTLTGRGEGLGKVLRLPIGRDAVQRWYTKLSAVEEAVGKTKEIAEWAVFDD